MQINVIFYVSGPEGLFYENIQAMDSCNLLLLVIPIISARGELPKTRFDCDCGMGQFEDNFTAPANNGYRMIGGEAVKGRQWMVNFQHTFRNIDGSSQEHVCGGSLVTAQWVVTAANCFCRGDNQDVLRCTKKFHRGRKRMVPSYDYKERWYALIGVHDTKMLEHKTKNPDKKSPHVFKLADLRIHHTYSGNAYKGHFTGDIAMVKLSKQVSLGFDVAHPICLPDQPIIPWQEKDVRVDGK